MLPTMGFIRCAFVSFGRSSGERRDFSRRPCPAARPGPQQEAGLRWRRPAGDDALHEARRGDGTARLLAAALDEPVLVGDDAQPAAGLQQFAGLQQEVAARGPAYRLLAVGKGLVDQEAARGDAVDERGQQRPPEVVGHQHGVEAPAGQGPGILLDVGNDELGEACKRSERRGVAVDAGQRETLRGQPAQVAPAAAGEVEDARARGQQVAPALQPARGLRRRCAVAAQKHAQTRPARSTASSGFR